MKNCKLFEEIDTPNLIIDSDKLLSNIREMQDLLKGTNIKLRPHTKTHKCPEIAKLQIKEGAQGITVAKLGEAEVMVENGIKDILIAFPVFGDRKKERLIKILQKAEISISLDSFEVANFLSNIGMEIGRKIPILLEVNTGLDRCGVEPVQESIRFLNRILNLHGIEFKGLMSYTGLVYTIDGSDARRDNVMKQYKKLISFNDILISSGINTEIISTGSTPSVEIERSLDKITELRPGGYIFNDRTHLSLGVISENQCAATILASVVSVPANNRAIIDAGSKVFCSDLLFGDLNMGFGLIKNRPDLFVYKLHEEHGFIGTRNENIKLSIGDRLEIIPNHICVVVNNFDLVYITKSNYVVDEFKISGRGKLQ